MQYANAEPFPHIALDGLFDDDALDAVLREFPSREAMRGASSIRPTGEEARLLSRDQHASRKPSATFSMR